MRSLCLCECYLRFALISALTTRRGATRRPPLDLKVQTSSFLSHSTSPLSSMAGKKRSAPAASRSPSPARTPPAPFHFPSVRRGQPLFDSYTFHSVDAEREGAAAVPLHEGEGKGKGRAVEGEEGRSLEQEHEREHERPKVEGEWMLGVDEAGRGPALGACSRALTQS